MGFDCSAQRLCPSFHPGLDPSGRTKSWARQPAVSVPLLALQACGAKEHRMMNGCSVSCNLARRLCWRTFNACVGVILFFRLVVFSLLLLIPFLRVGHSYFTDRRVRRNIRCGPHMRSFVDIYCPEEAVAAEQGVQPKVPVVVAIMGGAWVINHRAWNAQLGQRLMDAGILMVAVEYRSYPFAGVPEMIDDLNRGLAWVFENIGDYGGDPANIMVTGQSAGAHLSALLLLQQSLSEAQAAEAPVNLQAQAAEPLENAEAGCVKRCSGWSLKDIRGYVGVSGPYDLQAMGEWLESRWIGDHLLHRICSGNKLQEYSPTLILQNSEWQAAGSRAAALLPPMLLFHGASDKTVPAASSVAFAQALRVAGATDAKADVRPRLAHAEVIIEGPMRGEDHQVQLLLPFLLGDAAESRIATMPPIQPMFPRCVINFASLFMPF